MATKTAKSVQAERVAKSAKTELETMINQMTGEIAGEISEINSEIKKTITGVDKIAAMETRQKLDRMKPADRATFLRRLQSSGDFESLSHVLGKSAAYLEIEVEDYQQAKESFVKGKFPEQSVRLEMLKKAQNGLKHGLFAAANDFNGIKSDASEAAEKAEKALSES